MFLSCGIYCPLLKITVLPLYVQTVKESPEESPLWVAVLVRAAAYLGRRIRSGRVAAARGGG
jgi:hypothetical protein